MTDHPEVWAALAAPFEPHQLKSRTQNGRQFTYITDRTAMNRLDDVLGPENWEDDTGPVPDGSGNYRCRLTVTLPGGRKVRKTGIGAPGKEASKANPGKAAAADAFKRAAVRFGVARYLYRDGVPGFVRDPQEGGTAAPPQPQPPPRRGPTPEPQPHRKERDQWGPGKPPQDGPKVHDGPPKSGKALFARLKDYEQSHGVGLLHYVNGWARLQEFPGRMVDWTAEQVELAYGEAKRKIREYERSDEVTEALAN